jgi:hypothetical protein
MPNRKVFCQTLPGRINIRCPEGHPPRNNKAGLPRLLVCDEAGCGWHRHGTQVSAMLHARDVHHGRAHVYMPLSKAELKQRKYASWRPCRANMVSLRATRKAVQEPVSPSQRVR